MYPGLGFGCCGLMGGLQFLDVGLCICVCVVCGLINLIECERCLVCNCDAYTIGGYVPGGKGYIHRMVLQPRPIGCDGLVVYDASEM